MKTHIAFFLLTLLVSISCHKEEKEVPNNIATHGQELPQFTITGGWKHVDNAAANEWHRYTEPFGNAITDIAVKTTDHSAPSGDSSVLQIGIHKSDPYTNIYRYQSKPFTEEVNWIYAIRYKYKGSSHPPQALEFPFSVYTGTKRLEMAMQWVSPIESGNPRWRVWCGTQGRWNDFRPGGAPYNFKQDLAADTWHSLIIIGKIQNDTIYYEKAISNGNVFSIRESYAGIANSTPAQCVLAFQLNNNFLGNEQHVYIDDYSVTWGR